MFTLVSMYVAIYSGVCSYIYVYLCLNLYLCKVFGTGFQDWPRAADNFRLGHAPLCYKLELPDMMYFPDLDEEMPEIPEPWTHAAGSINGIQHLVGSRFRCGMKLWDCVSRQRRYCWGLGSLCYA